MAYDLNRGFMRILLVSDVHANRAALDAIREPYDACLCLGDLVDYGPDVTGTLDWVKANASHTVRGNHDHGAVQNVDVVGRSGFRYLTMATRQMTVQRLTTDNRHFLANLPTTRMLSLGGMRFLLVHASPRDPLDEYVPTNPDAWGARIAGLRVDFVCVGHTHVQFDLDVGKTKVVNPGSVGLQRDGDPRAKYAIIEDGRVSLRQVPYDVDRTISAVHAAPIDPMAKQLLTEVYRTGRYVAVDMKTPLPGGGTAPLGLQNSSSATESTAAR